jgi:glycogen synthase
LLTRKELIKELTSSKVFILSSEWDEPFAIAPLEAMAAGCAVIAIGTGGSLELFKHDDNALIFKTGDIKSLYDNIFKLIKKPSLLYDISLNGNSIIKQNHRISTMLEKIDNSLKNLMLKK